MKYDIAENYLVSVKQKSLLKADDIALVLSNETLVPVVTTISPYGHVHRLYSGMNVSVIMCQKPNCVVCFLTNIKLIYF